MGSGAAGTARMADGGGGADLGSLLTDSSKFDTVEDATQAEDTAALRRIEQTQSTGDAIRPATQADSVDTLADRTST